MGIEDHLPYMNESQVKVFVLAIAREQRTGKMRGRIGKRALFVDKLGKKASTYRALGSLVEAGYLRVDEKGVVWLLNREGGESAAKPTELKKLWSAARRSLPGRLDGRASKSPPETNSLPGRRTVSPGDEKSPRETRSAPKPNEAKGVAPSRDVRRDVRRDARERRGAEAPALPGMDPPKRARRKRSNNEPTNPYPFEIHWNAKAQGIGIDASNLKLCVEHFEQFAAANEVRVASVQKLLRRAQPKFERHALQHGYWKVSPSRLTALWGKWVEGDVLGGKGESRGTKQEDRDERTAAGLRAVLEKYD